MQVQAQGLYKGEGRTRGSCEGGESHVQCLGTERVMAAKVITTQGETVSYQWRRRLSCLYARRNGNLLRKRQVPPGVCTCGA